MVTSLNRSLEAQLASVKDPDYDSSDGDDDVGDDEPETISTKRTKGSKGKVHKKDIAPSKGNHSEDQPSTVIYLGHLPAGFEEREITVFLNQFGNVKRCRVSRSKKTGRSRGYAFVDFDDLEVAKIVAETMSGYFLLEKRLVCHVLPADRVHELMFTKPKRVLSKADLQKKKRLEVNKRRSVEVLKEITARLVKREELKRKKLSSLGIDYDFPGYVSSAQSVEAIRGARDSESGSKEDGNEGRGENVSNDANQMKVEESPNPNKKKKRKTKEIDIISSETPDVTKTESKEESTSKDNSKKSRKKKRKKYGVTDEQREPITETSATKVDESSSKKMAKSEDTPAAAKNDQKLVKSKLHEKKDDTTQSNKSIALTQTPSNNNSEKSSKKASKKSKEEGTPVPKKEEHKHDVTQLSEKEKGCEKAVDTLECVENVAPSSKKKKKKKHGKNHSTAHDQQKEAKKSKT